MSPFHALAPGDKFFKVQVDHREETISIDRLKITHVDESAEVQVAQPPRCGHPPHPPTQPAILPPQEQPSALIQGIICPVRIIRTPRRFLD